MQIGGARKQVLGLNLDRVRFLTINVPPPLAYFFPRAYLPLDLFLLVPLEMLLLSPLLFLSRPRLRRLQYLHKCEPGLICFPQSGSDCDIISVSPRGVSLY